MMVVLPDACVRDKTPWLYRFSVLTASVAHSARWRIEVTCSAAANQPSSVLSDTVTSAHAQDH
jgi:hypothetical protein